MDCFLSDSLTKCEDSCGATMSKHTEMCEQEKVLGCFVLLRDTVESCVMNKLFDINLEKCHAGLTCKCL